jgi:hypothetical protein
MLHCPVLDGVYRNCNGVPVFHEAAAPSTDELEAMLLKIVTRIMRLLTRLGLSSKNQTGPTLPKPIPMER